MEKRKIVMRRKNNYSIFADLFEPENGPIKKVVIGLHGFLGSKDGTTFPLLAEKLTQKNVALFTFDFPAHGSSKAKDSDLTISNCVLDLIFVQQFLQKMFKGAKFGIFATSFGATVALLTLFLGKNKYENFVLCAPGIHLLKALSVVSRTEGKTSSMNELKSNGGLSCGFERRVFVPYRFFEESEKLNLAHAYKNKNQTKIHIFQGNQDKVVDPHDVVKFQEVDKKNITIEIIKDAGHQFKAEKSFGRIINKSAKLLSDPQ